MTSSVQERRWSKFFLSAALFNYAMGLPMFLLRQWSYNLTYLPSVGRDPMAIRNWAAFGFAVILIGMGYQIVARDVRKNRGIVFLGVIAKLFDVINLSLLYLWGFARPVVLVPAIVDGIFGALFVVFLLSRTGKLESNR